MHNISSKEQSSQKLMCYEIFTTKENCLPPSPLNFAFCYTGFIERGAYFACLCFKITVKVLKDTCYLYADMTMHKINTRHFIQSIFLGVWEPQNLSLPPGASYPRDKGSTTCFIFILLPILWKETRAK